MSLTIRPKHTLLVERRAGPSHLLTGSVRRGAQGQPAQPRLTGTSSTSVTVGSGTKTFTTQNDRDWALGARLRVSSNANPSVNWMEGVITAYSSTSLELSIDATGGTGTYADWTINLSGAQGASGDTTEAVLQAASAKGSLVDADRVPMLDSAASNALKYVLASTLATFIMAQIVDSAPATLDTLNELAAALGDDPNFAATMTTALAGKQASNANLTALAGQTGAANKIPYFTGPGAMALFDFKDEDDFASDSATALASQQSIKAFVLANAGGGGNASFVVDRTALKAVSSPSAGDAVYLVEGGRFGLFKFDDSDLSAEVAADTQEAIYVSSGDGSGGAWVRQYQLGYLESNWFGHATAETAANNDTALQACLAYAMAEAGPSIVQMPSGTFSHNTDALTIGAVTNKRIIVKGRGASTILSFTASSASNGFWIGHATAAQSGFACRLEDFRINGNNQTYITGIYMKYASGQVVTNVWFQTLLECVAIETCFSVQLRLNNARNIGADFFRAVDRTHNFCAEGNKLFTLGNYAYNFQGTLGHLGIYIAGAGNEDIEGAVGFVKSAGPLYSFVFRDVYSEQTTGDIFDFGDVVWGEITNNIFQFGNSHTTDIENFVGRWDNNRLYDVQITWGSGSFPKVGSANTVASGGSFPAMPFRERELIYHSADAVSHTGDTSETTLVTVTIPAGVLGTKGFVEWDATWQAGASNANAKTLRARLDGISGTAFYAGSLAGSRIIRAHGGFANTAADAQKGRFVSAGGGSGGQFGTAAAVPVTAAVDTGADVDLVFTVELANSGDTCGLEMLTVWLTRG